jgi:hypothetical protein
MPLKDLISLSQPQKRDIIIDYLLTHQNPFQRTQISMMRELGLSQATLVRYLAELKGEGLVVERPFGSAVVYEISYDVAIARGLVKKYETLFDLSQYLAATGQQNNQEWTGKVFKFGDDIYIYARHKNGFTIGIPIYDKDWKELVQAAALGLNIQAVITAIVSYFGQR